MEIVIPESIETAIMDENRAAPAAYSMFEAPFVVTSRSNFGEALRPITVTKVEKLFASMKIKNMKEEIRIDDITYAGFLKTIRNALFITITFIV
ncbi:MAG: hypothetical protein D4R72_00835 [Nitrosopumilales archaeon]|nr:MAG: hypothetical protein D4R72_00835 [Nitrosopumilales archaeon]